MPLKKYPDFLILPTIGLFLTRNRIENIFTYSFIVPYLLIWFFVMSNEIRYLYPLYLFIILFGYKNIIELFFLYKNKIYLIRKIILFSVIFLSILILLFNNNILTYSKFLEDVSNKKIEITNDPEGINPQFNRKIVNYFKNENLEKIIQ